MTVGVAVNNFKLFGWAAYAWPRNPAVIYPPAWNAVTLGPESGAVSRSLQVGVNCPNAGIVSVLYGLRPGTYFGRRSAAVPAGLGATIRIPELRYGTTYYALPIWTGVIPNAAAGLPLPMSVQYGELSASTPADPSLTVPPTITSTSTDTSGGGGGVDFAVGTNVPCSGYIEYGTTTAYGTQAPFTSGNGLAGNLLRVSLVLTVGTTYHYRAVVTGLSAPNNVQTIGPDRTVVPAA